jgi:hypothetical protein
LLPDGRLLVAGGSLAGAAVAGPYDGTTKTWGQWVPMNNQRYYPSNLPLANGEQLVIAGGTGKKNAQGQTIENTIPQVWQLNGTFRNLTGANMKQPQYPWLSLAPDGRVFIAGPYAANYWLTTSGAGTITRAIAIAHSTWKVSRNGGVPVTFWPGKVLITGGANRAVRPVPVTPSCEMIDFNLPGPWKWQKVGDMAQPRVDHMGMVLPTGEVLVVGGTTSFSGVGDEEAGHDGDETKAVMVPELWNPTNPNVWRPLAPHQVPRLYHSTGGLLPDGRVYVAGGGKKDGFVDQRTAEIYSPPYLFRGARPLITGIVSQLGNNQVRYGEAFTVLTANTNITRATLVRLPSATHSLDFNQRFNGLSTVVKVAGGYRVTAPPNGNVCPPGHYYLHLINAAGVPSVAKIIKVL